MLPDFLTKSGTKAGTNWKAMEQNLLKGSYTIPEISISNSKDWFVYFRFTHAGIEYLRKYREGLNRVKDKGQKMAKAEQLQQQYTEWLKNGWNPIIDPEFKVRNLSPILTKQEMYLKEAVSFALSKKKLASKSVLCYKSMLNFIEEIATKHGYNLLSIAQFDRGVCLTLIDECAKVRNFTNHNYNKHVSVLRGVFSVLVDYRLLNSNPLLGYKDKDVPESDFYQDYTEKEKEQIAKHLLNVYPQLFTLMSIVYHTGIRPKEVLALKILDIDLEALIITIRPEEGAENSKTNNVRKIPINPNVVDLSKKRCFHGGVGIDNEVICNEYIRRGGVIVENQQKITGSK